VRDLARLITGPPRRVGWQIQRPQLRTRPLSVRIEYGQLIRSAITVAGIVGYAANNSRIRGSNPSTNEPTGARRYFGGPSLSSAAFTVFLEIPITRAISEIGMPSARRSRRISAQSSTSNTCFLPSSIQARVLGKLVKFSVAARWSVFSCRRQLCPSPSAADATDPTPPMREQAGSGGVRRGQADRTAWSGAGGTSFECASPAQEESREPIRGANTVKLARTGHDSARVILLVRGSPFDSIRPGQTHRTCLGVKGSQVQILSSRPTRGPLTLDETPCQRASLGLLVDLAGWGTCAESGTIWGPLCVVDDSFDDNVGSAALIVVFE
jgi:hypothetical protein